MNFQSDEHHNLESDEQSLQNKQDNISAEFADFYHTFNTDFGGKSVEISVKPSQSTTLLLAAGGIITLTKQFYKWRSLQTYKLQDSKSAFLTAD